MPMMLHQSERESISLGLKVIFDRRSLTTSPQCFQEALTRLLDPTNPRALRTAVTAPKGEVLLDRKTRLKGDVDQIFRLE